MADKEASGDSQSILASFLAIEEAFTKVQTTITGLIDKNKLGNTLDSFAGELTNFKSKLQQLQNIATGKDTAIDGTLNQIDNDAKQQAAAEPVPTELPSVMKGLIKNEPTVGFEYSGELKVPEPGEGEVLVQSFRVGICGSDIILYDWTKAASIIAKVPFTPGHEAAGLIVKTGDKVDNLKVGQRVAIENHFYCGNCFQCKQGRGDICANMSQFGHGKGTVYGGCSEYFIVKANYCYPLANDDTSWRDAALLEPLGVALNAVERAEVPSSPEETVLVIGSGTIGALAVGVCKAYKATKVIVFDVLEWKLEIAKKYGADVVVNVSQYKDNFNDVIDLIMKETDGVGVGKIIECSGHAQTISNMFKLLRKGGNVVLIGLPKQPLKFEDPMPDIVFKSLTLRTIHGRRIFDTWQKAEALVAKKLIDLDHVVTSEIELSNFEDGYAKLKSGKALKIIFDPTK